MTSVRQASRPAGVVLAGGHTADVFAAAGSFGFDGRGYIWQRPWHWFGWADPSRLTPITKSLTAKRRAGNWRWWAPWRSVRYLGRGNMVNAMGNPSMGIIAWVRDCLPRIEAAGLKMVVSLWADNAEDMAMMVDLLCGLGSPAIVGLELNLSCPNVGQEEYDLLLHIARVSHAAAAGRLPLLGKLGCNGKAKRLALAIDELVAAVDVINTVPWDEIYPKQTSPLEKYGYKGGVSGPDIVPFAREMTVFCTGLTHARVISGGGVRDGREAAYRVGLGAHAISVGTAVTFSPGKANEIAGEVRSWPDAAEITR